MTTSYQRIPLSDNIAFSEILDSKLKTNHLRIQFLHLCRNRLLLPAPSPGALWFPAAKPIPPMRQ